MHDYRHPHRQAACAFDARTVDPAIHLGHTHIVRAQGAGGAGSGRHNLGLKGERGWGVGGVRALFWAHFGHKPSQAHRCIAIDLTDLKAMRNPLRTHLRLTAGRETACPAHPALLGHTRGHLACQIGTLAAPYLIATPKERSRAVAVHGGGVG